jgi:c-di-GMP-binding flagellar brake protein YcgR
MQRRTDPTALQLGDSVLIETCLDQATLVLRGKLSNLLPKVVWVNVAEPGCPPQVSYLREGHPVLLSAARDSHALVGETTFLSCLGVTRRVVAVERPTDLRLVDRRSPFRVAVRRPVGIRLTRNQAAGESGHFVIGTSCDISLAGMSFEATMHIAVGDHVFITMVLDQNQPLYALAQVVRIDDAVTERPLVRAAVKWDAIGPADRERLQSFLALVHRAVSG